MCRTQVKIGCLDVLTVVTVSIVASQTTISNVHHVQDYLMLTIQNPTRHTRSHVSHEQWNVSIHCYGTQFNKGSNHCSLLFNLNYLHIVNYHQPCTITVGSIALNILCTFILSFRVFRLRFAYRKEIINLLRVPCELNN